MAALEVSPLPATGSENWTNEFAVALARQRERVREFLAAQQQRLKRAEVQLAEQAEHLAEELLRGQAETRQAKEEVRQQSEHLTRQIDGLETIRREFAARQADWVEFQQRAVAQQELLFEQVRAEREQLQRRQVELEQQYADLRQQRADEQAGLRQQAEAVQQCQQVQEFFRAQEERLHQAEARLSEQLEDLVSEFARNQGETSQAKQDIRQHCEQWTAQVESLKTLREEFAARQTQWVELQQRAEQQQEMLLEQLRRQQDDLQQRREELQQQRADEQDGLRQQLEGARQRETQLSAEVESLRKRCEEMAQRSREASCAPSGGEQAALEDYHRRYDMALDDLRELKDRNAELQQQLAKARAAPPPPAASASGALDWEAEKKRILAALESTADDDDDDDAPAQAERLQIADVVATTEQIVAERDREIEELKQLLADQSKNLGSVAVGAAAVGAMLDNDAIIREEREKLKQLQEQWRDKRRQAEVDISLERAAIARERAKLEEELHALEKLKPAEHGGGAEQPDKPTRGRWLARLGLKDVG